MKNHKIEFEKDSHIYKVNGYVVPCVSEVISSAEISDYSSVPKHILENAIIYGSYVHKALEYYDNGVLDFSKLDDRLMPDVNGWKKFKEDFGVEIIHVELIVYSEKWGYIGTLDRVAKITKGKYKGKVAVIDIKTKTSIDPSCELQIDGYQTAYNESNKPKSNCKLIVQLLGNENYKLHDANSPENSGIFIHAISLHSWKVLKGITKRKE